MRPPQTFFLPDGNERIQVVAQPIRLNTFTGDDTAKTFDLVVGVDDRDAISQAIANQTYSAPPNFRMLFRLLRPGCVVMDLGANVGTFSLAAAAAGCRVIAVEASPHNVTLLQASVARNRFSHVKVVHAAVSDRIGELEFVQNGPYGYVSVHGMQQPTVKVSALTVDGLLEQLGIDRVDLIKMDIEGSEVAGIRGMRTLLARPDSPPIFYESNGHTLRLFDETPYTLKGALEAGGYRNYLCESEELVPTRADELQADCIVDYLAAKQLPAKLRRWQRSDPLSREAVIQRVLAESKHPNPHHRANLARALAAKGSELLSDRRVRNALLALSRDAEPDVRAAAAWYSERRAGPYPKKSPARVARTDSKLRIGLDYRFLSGGINIARGMGRYTQQQLREVLKLDTHNEYVLFCPPRADRSLILPAIRSAPNVSLATIDVSDDKTVGDPNRLEKVLLYTEEYQDWIYRQRVDLYHATTPFLLNDTAPPHFDVCPMVATFYDAIPLVFPDKYLPPSDPTAALYARATQFIRCARRFLAISDSARQDAIRYFGYPADHIDVAYPIADPWFQVMPPAVVSSRLGGLRKRVSLPESFVMAVPHLHHSKGFDTLLDAYACVSPHIRKRLPLVITCDFTEAEKDHVRSLSHSRGMADDVIVTGFVSDEELAALYNAATMFVHASRYEGFGLPVLEAMRCGTPVITMASSSLPEVGGDAALLVEPNDPRGLAEAVEALFHDSDRREAMSQRGLEQARKFDPGQLGQTTLACYQKALQSDTGSEPAKPRLAVWTPVPPQRSGVADYSANILLSSLSRLYDIEVFVDDDIWPNLDLVQFCKVLHHSAFERRHSQSEFDVIVYQVGASKFHIYMLDYMYRHPGIVVLHDLTWSYAVYGHFAALGQLAEFQQELLNTEGPQAVRQFRQVLQTAQDLRPAQLFAFLNQHFMLNKIVACSLGLIVHMEASAIELRHRYAAEKVFVVPHGAEDVLLEARGLRRQDIKAAVGVDGEVFLVGVFGILDPVKRVDVTIQAFKQLLTTYPLARLAIVGEAPDRAYGDSLRQLAESLGIARAVTFTGYATDEALKQWVRACDVVVNLRYPSRQQMSGTLVRAIAAAKLVIMTDLPEWRFLPSEFCWRLAPDEREVDTLADYLLQIATNAPLVTSLSAKARAYYESELKPWQMAERYQAVFEKVYAIRPAVHPRGDPQDGSPMRMLNFNKVCELEDFDDPELVAIMRDVFRHEIRYFTPDFPRGAEYRKYWEIAMSVRALRQLGALRPDAVLLGVGAGTETTLFYLTNHVRQVFATDLYLNSGVWGKFPPEFMLFEPEKIAPYEFNPGRLVVQHMDGRALRYPDNTFDGIFSSGSIEHFGDLQSIANAAFEMGRVLKPGGILTLSTEFQLSGPPGGVGWEGVVLFSRENLLRYIVEASGLELADDLCTKVSDQTLSSRRDLTMSIQDADAYFSQQGDYPRAGEIIWSKYPHLVQVHQGYVFASVHLTLRKTERYPLVNNDWARPTPATHEAIARLNPRAPARPAVSAPRVDSTASPMPNPMEAVTARSRGAMALEWLRSRLHAWELIRLKGWHNRVLRRLPTGLAAFVRAVARVVYLGHAQQAQAQLYQAIVDNLAEAGERLDQVAARVAHAGERLDQVAARVAKVGERLDQVAARVAKVGEHVTEASARLDAADARLAGLAVLEAQVLRNREEIDALQRQKTGQALSEAEHLDQVAARQSNLEAQVRQTTSQLRLLLQEHALSRGPAVKPPTQTLAPPELIELLTFLEREVPGLADCSAVELSIQDESAENVLVAGTEYFGERLSSKGPTYRVPNDGWYHVDFSTEWSRPVLFESAAARLALGGLFVLVTSPEHPQPEGHVRLQAVSNQLVALTSDKRVRTYVWRAE